MNKKSAFIQIK